jgi:hypothetical protein
MLETLKSLLATKIAFSSVIYYKLIILKYLITKHKSYYNSPFSKRKHLHTSVTATGVKAHTGPRFTLIPACLIAKIARSCNISPQPPSTPRHSLRRQPSPQPGHFFINSKRHLCVLGHLRRLIRNMFCVNDLCHLYTLFTHMHECVYCHHT